MLFKRKPKDIADDVRQKLYQEYQFNADDHAQNNPLLSKKLSVEAINTALQHMEKSEHGGKKTAQALDKDNKKLQKEKERWKNLAERYYKNCQLLEKQLKQEKKELLKTLLSIRIALSILKVLKTPGLIGILLLANLFLLLLIGKDVIQPTKASSTPRTQTSETESKTNLPYTIQVKVFNDFEEAKDLVLALKGKGFEDVYISKLFNSHSDVYRVYLGYFSSVKSAETTLATLKKKGFYFNSFIRRRF